MMIDPVTVGTAAAGLLALDPVKKLLGPTADFLGAELAAYTRRRLSHAEKIIEIAAEHVVNDSSTASVSPRVLLAALDEGSKVESEIAQKYFGGVLASSRSENGEDDGAIIFTSILSTMSAAQIKLHCALYAALRLRWRGSKEQLGNEAGRTRLTTNITFKELTDAFGPAFVVEFETGMFGLNRQGLIGNFSYGSWMRHSSGKATPYLSFAPTVLGASLYLAANGHYSRMSTMILQEDLVFEDIVSINRESVFANSQIEKVDPATLPPEAIVLERKL